MGNGCDVKIEIDRSGTGGTFTNHDIIRGTITLTVTTSILLSYIQAKLEGITKTELHVPTMTRKGREKDRLLQDVHKVLYDTLIVFPPSNVRKVSQAKEFTLNPGNYSYPFEFKIPLNSSCSQLKGITNKVLFNMKKMDLVINNGNFNTNALRNMAQSYYQNYAGVPSSQQSPQAHQEQQYHITSQLPPSLSLGDFASVKYYVKVTCKRASFLKANLRSFDPFVFLPLDLDSHNQPIHLGGEFEEYREVFFRKELIFKDRLPSIVAVKIPSSKSNNGSDIQFKQNNYRPPPQPKKSGTFSSMFRSSSGNSAPMSSKPSSPFSRDNAPEINMYDVPFSFEVRFRHPAFLIPTKAPSFKLFLVSNVKPSRYSLAQYGKPDDSNGLGVVYLQKLIVELVSTTTISVLENDSGSTREIHEAKHDDVINVCNNTYENLKLDLFNARKLKSLNSSITSTQRESNAIYELEIPAKYYENSILPRHLSPSFRTCNIDRKYTLNILAGFLSEKITDFNKGSEEMTKKVKYVDINCLNIKVLSGLNLTSNLHHNALKTRLSSVSSGTSSVPNNVNGYSSAQTEKDQLQNYHQQQDQQQHEQQHQQHPPAFPARPVETPNTNSTHSIPQTSQDNEWSDSVQLPTYDDALRESTYQDDSEHYRARSRYHQHNI